MLIDTTLREGAQMFGTSFDTATRRTILSLLVRVGVEEVEAGWVGRQDLQEFVRWARAEAGSTALGLWSRLDEADVAAAAALGLAGSDVRLNVGVPVSDAHIEQRLGLSRGQLLTRLARVLGAARRAGLAYVSVGLEDVSRADEAFALDAARLAEAHGAARIRLADSVGLLTPLRTAALVARFKAAVGLPLAVHCHDDFGMATANAVSALEAGADFADGSILGIGERAGIAASEEVLAWLALGPRGRNYRVELLRDLCRFVSAAAGTPVARHKAVAGRDIFACESGLHVHGLLREPSLLEPFAPETLGERRILAAGEKTGRAAVRGLAARLGVVLSGSALPTLTGAVREMSRLLGRPLAEDELAGLARRAARQHGLGRRITGCADSGR